MTAPISLRQKLEWSRACKQAIPTYLETHQVRGLQIGTGANILDNWFNTDLAPASPDVFFLDSTQRFPFDDATFDYVFSEHHIEHITYREGLHTLGECYRILKPGGKIRIATPSLEALMSLYSPSLNELQQRYIQFITDLFLPEMHIYSPAFVINNAFRNWGHQFLYDRATLQGTLEEAGFVDIVRAMPGESNDRQFCGIEKHGQFIRSEEMNRFETIVLEARRPL